MSFLKLPLKPVLDKFYAAKEHLHGNVTDDGKIEGASNKNVVTDANGKITTENKPTIPSASSTTPSADTTNGSIGSGTTWAKADHTHPKSTIYSSSDHNHDGTYLKTGTGTVTSTNIANNTIVNEDIASNANIAFAKLNITKNDITGLGIPASDTNTTYTAATQSANGLMSSSDKTKLDGIATGANKTTVDSSLSSSSTNPVQNKVINTALSGKAASTHNHTKSEITDFPTDATTSTSGLMSSTDKTKLDGIATSANNYSHPSYTARTGKPTANQTPGFGQTATVSQITSDASGHVTGANDFTIKIPSSTATTSAAGLMSSTDKTKLDGIATGANKTTVDTALSSTSTNPVQNKVINTAISNLQNGIANIELIEVVTDLPTTNISTNKLYFKANNTSESENLYDIFAYVGDNWEHIDALNIDISEYLKKADLGAGTGLTKSGTTLGISNGGVGATQLASNAVETAKIKDSNVTTAKIADSAVTSAKIADGTIVNGDIANTTITGGKLVNGTITATQLASNAVETAKIKDGAVTNAKLAGTVVANGTNLNTLRTAGFYYQSSDNNTSNNTNMPRNIKKAFTLLVESFGSSTFTKQTLTFWNYDGYDAPQTFIRTSHYSNDIWTKWQEIEYIDDYHQYSAGNGTVGYYKMLTLDITGSYADNAITFSVNARNQPKTNISINFSYYKKDNSSNDFYYKIDKFYYDGYPIGCYIVQTGDAVAHGTFDFYVYRSGWNDMSISQVDTNWRVRNGLTITKSGSLVTSLPTGYITATRNPYYNDTNTTYTADNSTLELSGTQFKVKDSGITSAKIADGTIVNADISSSAAIATSKISGLNTALSGKAPTSHAVNANTYGLGTASVYGHTKAGTAVGAADTANGSAGTDNGLYARADHVHKQSDIYAPKSHATTATTYGGGTASNYGHVKVSDNTSSSAGNASQSVAASSAAVKAIYDIANPLKERYNGNFISGVSTVTKPYLRLFHIASSNGSASSSHLIFEIIGNNNDRLYAKIRVDMRQNNVGANGSASSYTVTPLEVYGFNLNELYFGFYDNHVNSQTCLDIYRKVGAYVNFYIRIADDHLRNGSYTMFTPVANGTESYTDLNEASTSLYNANYTSTSQGGTYTEVTNTIPYTNVNANKFVKRDGTSSQFLKADGSVDSTTYVATGDSRLSNARTPTAHTDSNGAYGKATTSVWGHTKLNSATNSTDETTAATPKAVKAAYDLANGKPSLGTTSTTAAKGDHNHDGTYLKSYTPPTASTSQAGIVQLNDATNNTSTTQAATANAVKKAYDLANGKPSLGTTSTTAAKGDHTHDYSSTYAPKIHTNTGSTATYGRATLSAWGHTKAGSFITADSIDGTVGTDNGFYARADHQHKQSDLYAEASHNHTMSNITDWLNKVYPIGSIYMNVDGTKDPNSLIGGTWVQISQGRMLLGAGTAPEDSTKTYTAGDTGGSKDAVVVSHHHNAAGDTQFISGNDGSIGRTSKRAFATENSGGIRYLYDTGTSITDSCCTTDQGVDGTDMNMPPYLVVYMWKRTA